MGQQRFEKDIVLGLIACLRKRRRRGKFRLGEIVKPVSESASTKRRPPRVRTSSMFDFSLCSSVSLGTVTITGIASVTSASGPCLSSPAGYPSA